MRLLSSPGCESVAYLGVRQRKEDRIAAAPLVSQVAPHASQTDEAPLSRADVLRESCQLFSLISVFCHKLLPTPLIDTINMKSVCTASKFSLLA